MNAVQSFFEACRDQEADGPPEDYTFEQGVLKPLRLFLVNLSEDEGQEDFFLGLIARKDGPVTLKNFYVDHLREYLTGAIK